MRSSETSKRLLILSKSVCISATLIAVSTMLIYYPIARMLTLVLFGRNSIARLPTRGLSTTSKSKGTAFGRRMGKINDIGRAAIGDVGIASGTMVSAEAVDTPTVDAKSSLHHGKRCIPAGLSQIRRQSGPTTL